MFAEKHGNGGAIRLYIIPSPVNLLQQSKEYDGV
jgi:hypothetical protein